MSVLTRLLESCAQYVTAKQSNLSHWHPVLGIELSILPYQHIVIFFLVMYCRMKYFFLKVFLGKHTGTQFMIEIRAIRIIAWPRIRSTIPASSYPMILVHILELKVDIISTKIIPVVWVL